MSREVGLLIAVVGLVLVGVGALAYTGALSWLGKLPGDVRIEQGNTRIFIPITSMLLVSAVLSLLLYLWGRFRS